MIEVYHRPTSLADALTELASADADTRLIAGGTDVMVELHAARVPPPGHVGRVAEQQLVALDVGQVHATSVRRESPGAVRHSSRVDARKCDNLEEERRPRNPNMVR